MKQIFNERPDEESQHEKGRQVVDVLETLGGRVDAEGHARPPDQRDNPPRRLAEGLQEVSKERRGLAALVVPGAVDLVEVELLAEAAEPDLREEGLAEVKEFVLLVVLIVVCFFVQVFLVCHARPGVYPIPICSAVTVAVQVSVAVDPDQLRPWLSTGYETNEGVFEHLVGSLGVVVGVGVLEDRCDVLPGPVKDEVGAAGVGVEEVCDVVDIVANGDIAGLGRAVRLDVGARQNRERTRRHGFVQISDRSEGGGEPGNSLGVAKARKGV